MTPIIAPAARPKSTEPYSPHGLTVVPSPLPVPRTRWIIAPDASAIIPVAAYTPRRSEERRERCEAFSPVRTKNVPIMEASTPATAIKNGIIKPRSPMPANAPRALAERTEPT